MLCPLTMNGPRLRYDDTRTSLEQVFIQKHATCEQKLLEVRSRKGECRERLEQYREELVRIMSCVKAENASINALSAIEAEVINIEQDNQRVKAAMGSSLQELKTGQALLSKDLTAKVTAHAHKLRSNGYAADAWRPLVRR